MRRLFQKIWFQFVFTSTVLLVSGGYLLVLALGYELKPAVWYIAYGLIFFGLLTALVGISFSVGAFVSRISRPPPRDPKA